MIVRTRGGRQIELRSFSLGSQARYGFSDLRTTSAYFSESAVRGIPAINRAARIRAEALGALRLCCWRDQPLPVKVTNVWQARLFADEPNEWQTRFGFWETVGESLAYRGNAYIWKNTDPQTERVVSMFCLHPDQVFPDARSRTYEVRVGADFLDPVGKGQARYSGLDASTILHIRGHGQGGTFVAPSPITVFKEALEAPLERQRYESRMWRRGGAIRLAIELPQQMSPKQADDFREIWRSTYEGTEESTAIIGGGGTIKPIGMTAEDAAFVDMSKITVHDASRIMGVPANLLGAQLERGVPKLEQDLMAWLRLGIGPELDRIESALMADDSLFGDAPPNAASVYPRFDTEEFVRGDLMTEAGILIGLVQAGILLPDEARALRGLDDLPAGIGKIPQITPVGGAPNAVPVPGVPAVGSASSNGSSGGLTGGDEGGY